MERTNTFQLNHPPLPRPLDRPGRLGTAGDVLKLTGQPLHSGCIAGLPDRILVVSSGLAVSMLAVTGNADVVEKLAQVASYALTTYTHRW